MAHHAQNMYDHFDFVEEFMHLPSQALSLSSAPQLASFKSLIPNLQGLKVLDLGWGIGCMCRWAREVGANDVLGVDVSSNMLHEVKKYPANSDIHYLQADLQTIELQPQAYDVVLSSLALHYVQDLPRILAEVFNTLTPGATFVFWIEHSNYTSPRNPEWNKDSNAPQDDYFYEGPRVTDLVDTVIKQYRKFATNVDMLIESGFVMKRIIEWEPTPEQ